MSASDAGGPADIVHLWTPRAPIWRFLQHYGRLIVGPLVLHLEDDENEILRSMGLADIPEDRAINRNALRIRGLEAWTHPTLASCLAHLADGATVLNPALADFFPESTPRLHIIPPARRELLDFDPSQSASVATPAITHPIVYAGAIHPAVADCFYELCRAVRQLAEAGYDVGLLRTGPPLAPEVAERSGKVTNRFFDLGLLPEAHYLAILRQGDVLVQPGIRNAFNCRRLPAKIVPYLLSGSPTVMPAFYDWLGVMDGEHAFHFDEGTASELARAIARVLDDPAAARAIAQRAREFARQKFDPVSCCTPLLRFYESLPRTSRVPWHRIRKPKVELPLTILAANDDTRQLPSTLLARTALEELRQPPCRPNDKTTIAQLFWPTSSGFIEERSSGAILKSHRWSRLIFGPDTIEQKTQVRFDPGNQPGIYEIAGVSFRANDGTLLHTARPPYDDRPEQGMHATILPLASEEKRTWRWLATGADPQLVLRAAFAGQAKFVEIWVRWDPLE